jgi:hypothetical protein
MAESVLTELQTSTLQRFMPIVTNQVFLHSPLLERIFKIAQEGQFGMATPSMDGREIVEPLEVGYVTAAAKGTGADVADTVGAYLTSDTWAAGEQDVLSGAHYAWKMYHVTLKIHNLTLAYNQGASRILDIAAIKLRNATKRLRLVLVEDLYGTQVDDDADGKFIGLRGAINGDPGAESLVGGIDMDTNAFWQGIKDAASTILTWDALNAAYIDTKKYGDGDPATVITATPGVLEAYEATLSKTVPTGAAGSSYFGVTMMTPSGEANRVSNAGYSAFNFKNIPMIEDQLAPSKHCFMLNEKYINWRVLRAFNSTGWESLKMLGKDYLQLTINGYGALTFSALRKQAKFSNITEA